MATQVVSSADRWQTAKVGHGVIYVTKTGAAIAAGIAKVHADELDPESENYEEERQAVLGKVDLSVANPANALDEPMIIEEVEHSPKEVRKLNSWHYA